MAQLNISKFFNNDASLLREARRKCIEIHGSDIRAAGNEVEIAVRAWLERLLPDIVSIGHGHVIDQNSTISPQIDCIVRDRKHLPTLFTSSDGTEYTPFESVYAVGEVKSTYSKSLKHIETFSKSIRKLNSELKRDLVDNTAKDGLRKGTFLQHLILGSSNPYLNQLFSFMLFVDSGNATIEDLKGIYQATPDEDLPDIAVFLNGCVVVKAAIINGRMQIYKYSDQAPPDVTWKIIPAPNIEGSDATREGKHLGFLYYCLLSHIQESSLEGPSLTKYLRELLVGSKSSIIAIEPQHRDATDG